MTGYVFGMIILAAAAFSATATSVLAADVRKIAPKNKATLNDHEIKKNVEQALRADPVLLSFAIEIAVKDGVVTLTGAVDSRDKKKAAAADAMSVAGVK